MRASAQFLGDTASTLKEEDAVSQTLGFAERVGPHIVDGVAFLHEALERGERVLAEGAQATMLDVGFGTYPYVTSSHTISGGACVGLGIGPNAIDRIIGVAKAYCTRVGGGPFPSELDGSVAEQLRERGHEYGTVTGRPRRVGWFDAVAGRYACRVNGLTSLVLTKLDVLSSLERIGVVTGYRQSSRAADVAAMAQGVDVELAWCDGWRKEFDPKARDLADLPLAARSYVEFLRNLLGVPMEFVSIGPERSAFVR
jgi:adenylosuccinate synthase